MILMKHTPERKGGDMPRAASRPIKVVSAGRPRKLLPFGESLPTGIVK